jgi:hypothetical protein
MLVLFSLMLVVLLGLGLGLSVMFVEFGLIFVVLDCLLMCWLNRLNWLFNLMFLMSWYFIFVFSMLMMGFNIDFSLPFVVLHLLNLMSLAFNVFMIDFLLLMNFMMLYLMNWLFHLHFLVDDFSLPLFRLSWLYLSNSLWDMLCLLGNNRLGFG